MTDIQLMLVLPPLDDGLLGDMTPKEIVEAITNARKAGDVKNEIQKGKDRLGTYARSLELILDEVDNQFEKAEALRKLAQAMKQESGR